MNFKKIAAALLAALCLFSLAACKEDETETSSGTQTTGSEAESGSEITRFDYFSADMRGYVSLDDYKNISVTLDESYQIDENSVPEYIELLCADNAVEGEEQITDRAVKEGDIVYLYYEGYLNGELFEGGSNMDDESPYALKIGSGAFIPGFEDALIGIVPGETSRENRVDLNLTFPESYGSADLAGKDVVFKVYIEYLTETVPAAYTEEFITDVLQFEAEGNDIKAEFEAHLLELLTVSAENAVKDLAWTEILDRLTVYFYPEGEVEYYYDSFVAQYEYYKTYYSYFGYSFESLDDFVCQYEGYPAGTDWKAETQKQSEMGVKQNLAFHYIAQLEGFTVTDDDYADSVQYYIDYYASSGTTYTAAQIEEMIGADMIKSQALFDKVTDLLVENTTVEYKEAEKETETE